MEKHETACNHRTMKTLLEDMKLLQPHEQKYAERMHPTVRQFGEDRGLGPRLWFDNQKTGNRYRDSGRVYLGIIYAGDVPNEFLIEPDSQTVKKEVVWEYPAIFKAEFEK